MRISEFKNLLQTVSELHFAEPNGELIAPSFHITEAGLHTKHFIDCGGTVRSERKASIQLWEGNDSAHRLAPAKLLKILALGQPLISDEDLEMVVEYGARSLGMYGLEYADGRFMLKDLHTQCLAMDTCGIPVYDLALADTSNQNCCTPGGGCC
jgi:hypothetical protein